MPPIARYTHVISYDRAGLGESEPAPRRRTCRNFINDLERVLEHNRIPGPYLLVGSSFGGHIIRYFASQHPGEVVGIVLVDPVHHDQNRLALALLPPPSPDDSFNLKAMRFLLTHGYADDPQVDPEGIDFFVCDDQVRAAGALGDLPLVVLTAGNRTPPTDLPADFLEAYHKMFEGLQVELAKLSTRGRQIIAKHSDHFIHEDEPELVVAVIREMVEQARQGAMLSPGRHGRKAP